MTTRAHEPGDRADKPHATAADPRRAHTPTATRSADLESHAAIAANALAHSDSPLPHRDRIAAAFGAYAVDDIRATVGGPAGATAAQLGARAFTVGDRIGFHTEPDLHLAAHEAAHAVQQRRGVELGSADGRAHDRYEDQADAVADAVVGGQSAEPLLSASPRGPATAALQLDEDDVDIGFEYTIVPFESRDYYASRGELPQRIGSGPDAITVDYTNTFININDVAGGQVTPATLTPKPVDLGMFGHPHPIPVTLGADTATMLADQMQLRIASLYATLTQIGERASAQDDTAGMIPGAQSVLRWVSNQLDPRPVPLPEFSLFDPSDLIPTEPAELSRQIVRSETVLDRLYEALVELSKELQQEEITGGAIAQLAPAHAGASYDLPDIRGRFMVQRWRYFTVANHVLQSRIVDDFNTADESHGDLDKYLLDQKLAYYQAIQPATKSQSDAAMASELRTWASGVAADVAWLRETALKLRAAREANQPDTALEAQFARKVQLVALSIQALGEFDMVVTAYEALRSANAVSGYNDVWLLWGRIEEMRTAARDEDVDYLQLLLRKHQEDPKVRAFYQSIAGRQATGIALTIFASLIVGLALGLIAGIVAWGASLAFMATVGIVVTSALGESLWVLIPLLLIRTGVMALAFTLTSRLLESVVYGKAPTTPFWEEFLWNWGLFFVTEGVSFALKGTLKALSAAERMIVSTGTNFALLQLYGYIRGSIEHGRFLTADEVLSMTGQNLFMMIGMWAGMKIFEPMMARVEGAVGLRQFRAKYGGEFDALATDRAAFEAEVRQRLQNDPNATEESTKDLRKTAEGLDTRLKTLVDNVANDSTIDLPAVRQEAAELFRGLGRMSVTQLLRSRGLAPALELLPTGLDGTYSFPRGRAGDVRTFFAADDSYHLQEIKTDGDKVFEVTVPGKGRIRIIESPTAERVVVPLTESELATARGEIAQDIAASDARAGGTRGRAAYQITETPGQDLPSVSRAMHQMAPGLASEGIALDGMAHKGIDVDGTVQPGAALTGTLRVTSGKASTTADVTIDVVADIDLQAPGSLFDSVHQGEAGYAKLSITPNGKGGWDVRISVDARLGSEIDVQIHMRHELREAAGILLDLAKDPSLGAAHIAEQQGAGIFQPGTETAVTHHGRAAVGELADVFVELEPAVRGYEQARKEVLAGGGKRVRAQRDAAEVAIRRLDAALDSLGFSDPATRPAKTQALLDTLGVKPDSPIGRYISDYGARTDAAIPRRAALDRISADRAAVDAKLGPDLAAHVAERAPAAAIDPLAQAVRAGNGDRAVDLVREHAGGRLSDDALVRGLGSITEPAPITTPGTKIVRPIPPGGTAIDAAGRKPPKKMMENPDLYYFEKGKFKRRPEPAPPFRPAAKPPTGVKVVRPIPEGGIPIDSPGVSAPKKLLADKDLYYFEKGKFLRRPEPEPPFRQQDGKDARAIPCFPQGTPVATLHGTTAIEAIAAGDEVLAYDEASRATTACRVTAVLRNRTLSVVDIALDMEPAEIIRATAGHRFWVENRGAFIAADRLEPGYLLRTAHGRLQPIDRISMRRVAETLTWNLTVDRCHTYFVGASRVLVHNAGESGGKIYIGRNPQGQIVYVGLTMDDLLDRQAAHRQDAINDPAKYGFKKDITLEVVDGMTGLTEDEMRWHERRIYDELKALGEPLQNLLEETTSYEKLNALYERYC